MSIDVYKCPGLHLDSQRPNDVGGVGAPRVPAIGRLAQLEGNLEQEHQWKENITTSGGKKTSGPVKTRSYMQYSLEVMLAGRRSRPLHSSMYW